MTTISCVNLAKTPLGVDFNTLVSVMQDFNDKVFSKIWYTALHNKLVVADTVPTNGWSLVFFDNADQAGALGYHDVTQQGHPIGKVFVNTTLQDGELVSVTAHHELMEMMVDPGCQMWANDASGTSLYAYEACDAVENDTFVYGGINLSNFVYPTFFQWWHPTGSVQFDHLGKISDPFETGVGGYQIVVTNGRIGQVFNKNDHAKARALGNKDHRGHRLERYLKIDIGRK